MKKTTIIIALLLTQIPQEASSKIYGVGYSVEYNEEKCSKDYPILISVSNRSLKDLRSFNLEISAAKKGYSKVLYKEGGYSSDKIIKKFSSDNFCFQFGSFHPYPGREDQIEIDRSLDPMKLWGKYGYEIGNLLISERASNTFIRLDPKYSPKDLNFYISKEYSDFDE